MVPRVVIDTNVVVSAIRSQRGASYRLLMLADSGKFETSVSVSLLLEYEQAARQSVKESALTVEDVDDVLDYLCHVAEHRRVFYLWRPALKDPKDDMVLELAVAAGCSYVVTFNGSDFSGAEHFGIKVVTPKEFLHVIGELP